MRAPNPPHMHPLYLTAKDLAEFFPGATYDQLRRKNTHMKRQLNKSRTQKLTRKEVLALLGQEEGGGDG